MYHQLKLSKIEFFEPGEEVENDSHYKTPRLSNIPTGTLPRKPHKQKLKPSSKGSERDGPLVKEESATVAINLTEVGNGVTYVAKDKSMKVSSGVSKDALYASKTRNKKRLFLF